MKLTSICIALICMFSIGACKKITASADVAANNTTDTVYTSDRTYNLNVVYFVPTDNPEIAGYQKRLSEILLRAQEFYESEMLRNGYSDKTFGLLKDADKGLVKIILIKGNLGKASYPYTGGSTAVMTEVTAYRSAHPDEFSSDHSLIILPAASYSSTGEPGGVPFYGTGKNCYALDYADFDLKYLGSSDTLGTRMTKWTGGMFHELGHGLNLPHNCAKQSERSNLGTALMGSGNLTYGLSPTFLTSADAAILSNNQVFNTGAATYYGSVTSAISRIHSSYNATTNAIIVSGRFTTNIPVTDILYYNDPDVNGEGTGANHDYNAVAWSTKVIGVDSFYVEMPVTDFQYKTTYDYQLKVKLVHNNGTVKETVYNYQFVNSQVVIDINTKDELSRTGWSVDSYSSQQTSAPATSLIDSNLSSSWHSQYSVAPAAVYPHYVTVNLGSVQTASGFIIGNGASRPVKTFDFLYSTDGVTYTLAGSYTLQKVTAKQAFYFTTPLNLKYFKILANSSWDGTQYAQLSDAGLFFD